MSTLVSQTIDKKSRRARLAIPIDPRDYWDETNKRFKSGIFNLSVTAISWTGTKEAGEILKLKVAPAVFDPACNDKWEAAPLVTGTQSIALSHNVSLNYGLVGPSSIIGDDGIASTLVLEAELPFETLSSIVITLTYTLTFTLRDPYSALSGTSKTCNLVLNYESDQVWGMVSTVQVDGYNGDIAIQISSIVSSIFQGENQAVAPVDFHFLNEPLQNGVRLANYQLPLPQLESHTKVIKDWGTYVFAVNNGKIDANAMKIKETDRTVYDLINFGLSKDPLMSGDKAVVDLNYILADNTTGG